MERYGRVDTLDHDDIDDDDDDDMSSIVSEQIILKTRALADPFGKYGEVSCAALPFNTGALG